MGNILRNSEVGVRLGRDFEDRAKTTSVGNARTPRVIPGILSCVRTTKQNRDANSVNSALLCTERLTNGGQGSIALWKNSSQLGGVSQDTEPSNKTQSAILKWYMTPREHSGRKDLIARCDSAHWFLSAQSLCSEIRGQV